jgi:uncharacterized protein (DUF885 family)
MTSDTRPVFHLASEYVDDLAALDPFSATYMGVPGHDHEVTDFSPDAIAAGLALRRRTLDRLASLSPAETDEQMARAVMADSLTGEIASLEAGDPYYEIRNIAGPVQSLREVFDLMPRATAEDWRNVIARLEGLPRSAASIRRLLEEALRIGKLSARRQVEEVLRQLATFTGDGDAPPAFAELVEELERSGVANNGLRADLEQAAGVGRSAFTELRSFLADRYLPAAPVAEAAGRERYVRAARQFLGMTIDPEETYAWGWEEYTRLANEIRATVERIQPGADLATVAATLDADPAYLVEGEAGLIAWLQGFQEATVRALNGTHFDLPEPVQRIEACIAPPGGALAQYYTGPNEDFSRPGRTWYPTGGKTRFPRWRDTSTAYHEGVPGHHLQIALTVYQREHLSRFQRLAVWYPGHGEGWALYAERLMAELGYLDDPALYLGMLLGQTLRAVRVIVDLGMHLELPIPAASPFHPGERWTYDLMLAALTELAAMPEDEARSEVIRYLGWPAQAIAYKVGERAWLRLRDDARARHGDAFSLKQFHMTALTLGTMGLDLLRETLRERY